MNNKHCTDNISSKVNGIRSKMISVRILCNHKKINKEFSAEHVQI